MCKRPCTHGAAGRQNGADGHHGRHHTGVVRRVGDAGVRAQRDASVTNTHHSMLTGQLRERAVSEEGLGHPPRVHAKVFGGYHRGGQKPAGAPRLVRRSLGDS